MFWNRNERTRRRQEVLDRLVEMAPDERRMALDDAVAGGIVRAEEVDEALRLASRLATRLDALRTMSLASDGGAEPAAAEPMDAQPAMARPAPASSDGFQARLRARRRASRALRAVA